jgi:hypothetical protein
VIQEERLSQLPQDNDVGEQLLAEIIDAVDIEDVASRDIAADSDVEHAAVPNFIEADFITPRQRSITYDRCIKHAWKYHDGRFARHPRFRYVVFNTLMRMQVNTRSTFFIRKGGGQSAPVDIQQLRAAFDLSLALCSTRLSAIQEASATQGHFGVAVETSSKPTFMA